MPPGGPGPDAGRPGTAQPWARPRPGRRLGCVPTLLSQKRRLREGPSSQEEPFTSEPQLSSCDTGQLRRGPSGAWVTLEGTGRVARDGWVGLIWVEKV